jgi:hypothetical protein
MKTTKYILLLLMIFFSTVSFAQNKIQFSYDDAGNRIKREIILGKSSEVSFDTTSALEPDTDWLDKMKITIYPNPTQGKLTIYITNLTPGAVGEITIQNMEGKCLQQPEPLKSTNLLDLSAFPPGIYILRIRSAQKTCEWKIVKE